MAKTILSEQWSINWRDFFRGLIMAVGTPVLYFVQELIPHWDVLPIYKIAGAALVTYLIKSFVEPTKIIEAKPSDRKVEEVKEDLAAMKLTIS